MEFKPVNREWVKNAAIIFLVVLLVLTFFSNTIMNRTLPEVATAYVTSGTITAKVRGSGTVVATGKHEVKVKQTRDIRSVMVKVGQEVKAGDVLFVTGQGDSKELETAKETLRQLQVSYQKAAVGMPIIDHRDLQADYNDAESKASTAKSKMDDAENAYNSAMSSADVKAAKARLDNAEANLVSIEKKYTEDRTAVLNKVYSDGSVSATYDGWQQIVAGIEAELAEIDAHPEDPNYAALRAAVLVRLDSARAVLDIAQGELDLLDTAYYTDIENARDKRDDYQIDYDLLVNPSKETYEKSVAAYDTALSAADSAYFALEDQKARDAQSLSVASIELQNIAAQIEIAQQKVKELSGEEGQQITANVAGIIDSIGCTAGDTVTSETVLCTIEVPDMGHTLSFSVTNDQAQRLRVGDTATVSNFYWGSEIVATLTTIRNDPKNPQTNKLLTFDLTGDVTSGSELTISVGQKSANYDLIVPNSSIRSDSNGSFVLMIEAKSSPLGNRYIARRVSVEVLASDDVNSAVTAGLNNGDYVITTSSAPVNNGDQVRMADSAT